MTSFKDKLNRELGEDALFSQQLKESILQQTKKPSRKKVHWQYSVVLFATLSILVLSILAGPWTKTDERQTIAQLDEVMKEQPSIKKFTVTNNNDRWTFAAQKYAWNVLQDNFEAKRDKQLLQELLDYARLGVGEMSSQGSYQDIYIEFKDGQILQLKLKAYETGLGFIDMQTNIFYVVEGEAAKNILALIANDLGIKPKVRVLVIFMLSLATVEYVTRRKLGSKRKDRYASQMHKIVERIFSVVVFFVIYLLMVSEWLLYKPVILVMLTFTMMMSISINHLFGYRLTEHLLSIVVWLISILIIIMIII
ncbi:hypothetical protein ABIA69_003179 [Lysinibacillus parviboronicapiens]|uniref:DUF4181 domain-containing protein n=1 Tax=Lysinibacillus parviboronicapiens TaxID=436516 RepID=A0ABV2PN28_9BACI